MKPSIFAHISRSAHLILALLYAPAITSAAKPDISYYPAAYILTINKPVSAISVVNKSEPPTSCTSSKPLPAGLMLNSDCSITGTPSKVQTPSIYLIMGSNKDGSSASTPIAFSVAEDVSKSSTISGAFYSTQISSGSTHVCSLTKEGKIFCWGDNSLLQLGLTSLSSSIEPLEVLGLYNVKQIVSGKNHSCALVDRDVYCWGHNYSGQLGQQNIYYSRPLRVPGLPPATAIYGGFNKTCANTSEGTFCWGEHGDDTCKTVSKQLDKHDCVGPQKIINLGNTSKITFGDNHTCALEEGRVYCWGDNSVGQLGNDDGPGQIFTPTLVKGLNGVTKLSSSPGGTCAFKENSWYCWGQGPWGEARDDGGFISQSGHPISALPGFSEVSFGYGDFACGVNNGETFCWGSNSYGQLGHGDQLESSTPKLLSSAGVSFINFSLGLTHSCGIDTTGRVLCWGSNKKGLLGNGQRTFVKLPRTVQGITQKVGSMSGALGHSCSILGDQVYCWGSNTEFGSSVVSNSAVPKLIPGFSGVTALSARDNTTCGVKRGRIFCGKLFLQGGFDSITGRITSGEQPQLFEGLSNVSEVGVGLGFICAIKAGEVYCFGENNDYGQLGNGSTQPSLVPVKVPQITGALHIAVGAYHACASTADSVFCWGDNNYTQLGNGVYGPTLQPVKVKGIPPGVSTLSSGHVHTCGIVAEQLYCWGYNGSGQLGIGDTYPNQATKVRGLFNVKAVSLGNRHTCAINQTELLCWGENTYGQLANGYDQTQSFSLPLLTPLKNVTSLTSGGAHTCAVDSNNLVCWGDNYFGQLGVGRFGFETRPVQVSKTSIVNRISSPAIAEY